MSRAAGSSIDCRRRETKRAFINSAIVKCRRGLGIKARRHLQAGCGTAPAPPARARRHR